MATAALATTRLAQHAGLVRQVHAAKTFLQLDDETYRAALRAHAGGKDSSKACTVAELQALVAHFHRAGFPKPGGGKRAQLTQPQKKMWSLWQQLADKGRVTNRTMKGLCAWVKAHTGGVEALAWLTPAQERTVIESLKSWVDRRD